MWNVVNVLDGFYRLGILYILRFLAVSFDALAPGVGTLRVYKLRLGGSSGYCQSFLSELSLVLANSHVRVLSVDQATCVSELHVTLICQIIDGSLVCYCGFQQFCYVPDVLTFNTGIVSLFDDL